MMIAATPGESISKVESNRKRFLAGEPFKFDIGDDLFKYEGGYISKNSHRDRSDFLFYCLLDVVTGFYFSYTLLIFGVKATTGSLYFEDMVFQKGGSNG